MKNMKPNPDQNVIRIIELKSGVVFIDSNDLLSLDLGAEGSKIKTQ